MNKTYCTAPFHHIYSDSTGEYRLCCHAYMHTNEVKQFNSKTHAPFEYFMSEAMEEVRNKMMSGEKVGGCEKCYEIEDRGFQSPRQFRYKSETAREFEVRNVELKLRIFGNHCNLSCYMCIPYNSSTRTKELKEIGIYDEISKGKKFDARINRNQWEVISKDILENIDIVGHIHITGGEPFLLPKHYNFIESIPEEAAARITLTYDTNFTTIEYKNKSIFEYLKKFKEVKFNVSCDHYGDKLEWIRYPIDVKAFESNLRSPELKKYSNMRINGLNVTASILNVEDLCEIRDYYMDNFGLECDFKNVVNTPSYLNVKNHPRRDELISKYKDLPEFNSISMNLAKPYSAKEWNYGMWYIKKLDSHRNTDYTKLWDYKEVDLIDVVNV